MSYTFECPECHKRLSGETSLQGTEIECPECELLFKAPAPGKKKRQAIGEVLEIIAGLLAVGALVCLWGCGADYVAEATNDASIRVATVNPAWLIDAGIWASGAIWTFLISQALIIRAKIDR